MVLGFSLRLSGQGAEFAIRLFLLERAGTQWRVARHALMRGGIMPPLTELPVTFSTKLEYFNGNHKLNNTLAENMTRYEYCFNSATTVISEAFEASRISKIGT
ncbi:unnamed protein product [Arctia plantaginis]|uniref:Uncharacterized protein n=1 Tax=Arctia plantaginis TaxID=874455 RepID=A0A8S1AB06_ARCPL|nr:unnamed protein product [Arctia plantaginis]